MKNLQDINLKNKKVLVRCDFNVSVDDDGKVFDDIRITEALPTIKYLINRKAKVIIISHRGRPKNKKSFQEEGFFSSLRSVFLNEKRTESLKPVYERLKEDLDNIKFINDCVGKEVKREVKKMEPGQVFILENLRYYSDEEENGDYFSQDLSSLADIYVNNAFSASHRDHASISGVAKRIPSYPGFLFEREIRVLSKLKNNVDRPFVVIVGGAKISSKAKTIDYFMGRADKILLGGKVANQILSMKGENLNLPKLEEDVLKKIKNINFESEKLFLPVDGVVAKNPDKRAKTIKIKNLKKDYNIYDIGPETIKKFSEVIKEAKTIVWAGPLGFFEKKNFKKGTSQVGKEIVMNEKALKVVGGGDTGFALKTFGIRDSVDHLSLGGGAMLAFLSGEKMPGVEALKK
jgi:3-phosphoglycerate kinase